MVRKLFRRKKNTIVDVEPVAPVPQPTDRESLKRLCLTVENTKNQVWGHIDAIDTRLYAVDAAENMDSSIEKSELLDLSTSLDELNNRYDQLIVSSFPELESTIRYRGRFRLSDEDKAKIDENVELKEMLDSINAELCNIGARQGELRVGIRAIENSGVRALAIGELEMYKSGLAGALYDLNEVIVEYNPLDISELDATCRTIYSRISGTLSTTKELIQGTNENVKLVLAEVFDGLEVPALHSYLSKQFEEEHA